MADSRRLVTLVLETDGVDVVGDEALLKDGKAVGYISSGGYGHRIEKSIAMGYVPSQFATDGATLDVEINGHFFTAVVRETPLYDPSGALMRS